MKYIIKPFSEIIVKSKPVRKRYLSFLQTNTNLALKRIDESLKVRFFWDKWELEIKDDIWELKIIQIIKTLQRIPGIESFIEVQEYDLWTLDEIIDNCVLLYSKDLEWKTFVVRVKRSWTHDFKSIDAERYIWWGILKKIENSKVDLHNPDFVLNIEIKDKKVFLVKNKYLWIWGFPVWTQDKVISLISWGFDSSVSSFSMIKRWCKMDYLFFNLWWKAHEVWVKEVANHIWKNFSAWYKARFITIPFEEVVNHLAKDINHRFRWIILKRLFLRIADKLAIENEYYAIVKWDSLWQVSSQTLKNMFVIDKASETLLLRPLISFNKQEIIDLSVKIWTYNFACNIPEYCGVISDKPATWASLEQILEEEKSFDFTLLDKAFENKKVEWVDKIPLSPTLSPKGRKGEEEIEIAYIPWEDEIVIDLREEPIEKENPLKLENVEILKIPFFDITYDFWGLDQSKTYLFYCDKWIMSKNFALSLKKKWFNNIKIYRPLIDDSSCKIGI